MKKGDKVVHIVHGECVIIKIAKDGAVWVRMPDGLEGTVSIQGLRRQR